jgi:hypothetical protein
LGRTLSFVERGIANGLSLDDVGKARHEHANRLYKLLRSFAPLVMEERMSSL